MRLKDKVIIVTGGSRGMGRAYCLGMAREGAKVIVNYVSDENAANEVLKEISDMGGEAHAFKADVGTKADVQEMVELDKKNQMINDNEDIFKEY